MASIKSVVQGYSVMELYQLLSERIVTVEDYLAAVRLYVEELEYLSEVDDEQE